MSRRGEAAVSSCSSVQPCALSKARASGRDANNVSRRTPGTRHRESGSRLVAQLATALEIIARRAPGHTTFVGMVVAEWRELVTQVSRAVAGERRNCEVIEKELFRGQYTLSSKNDDDLPIVP